MRHGIAHRKLGRDSAHRKSLLRNLVSSLVIHDRIRTTLPKAKEAQPLADRLVTLAKIGNEKSRMKAQSILFQHTITIPKLFDIMSKRYTTRPGGYTRILKVGTKRFGASPMAILEYVDSPGDTKISLAQTQIPALQKSISQLSTELETLSTSTPNFLPPRHARCTINPRHRPQPFFTKQTLANLKSKIRTMDKVQTKLKTVIKLPYLPSGHVETKWPAQDDQIRVEKRVWIEPLPKPDKQGKPRSVIKVKRRTCLVKIDKTVPLKEMAVKPVQNRHLCI